MKNNVRLTQLLSETQKGGLFNLKAGMELLLMNTKNFLLIKTMFVQSVRKYAIPDNL